MIVLDDFIKKPRKNNPQQKDTKYRCYCDKCKKDRGYKSKGRANRLCRSCAGKISHANMSDETKKKMSTAKTGSTPWNKGLTKIDSPKIKGGRKKNQTPWNKNLKISNKTEQEKRNIRASRAKHRYNNEIDFKLRSILRARLNMALRNSHKSGSAVNDLGCSIKELKKHLESQFQPGMNWDNYGKGGWTIDHIIPLTYFKLNYIEDLLIACNYMNLQPLWEADNFSKNNKRIVYLLTGAPASGKSWTCSGLDSILDPIDLDVVRKSKLKDLLHKAYRPIIAMTIGVSTFIKNNPDLDIKLIVIVEDESTIRSRLNKRNGTWTKTIDNRIKRMKSLSKKSTFSGTASEVLSFLNTAKF